jgi:UDP-N-acetylglucosamine:LPS N-acetylglucosamine transferase
LKVGLVASAGGHLVELLKIAGPCIGPRTFAVTTSEVVKNAFEGAVRTYVVGECNRQHLFRVILVVLRCARILLRERPDVIVSTGAAVGCVTCLLAKILGAKVVWLDSITNVNRPSLSGRLVRPFADLFLVQWPELTQGRRGVEYAGTAV